MLRPRRSDRTALENFLQAHYERYRGAVEVTSAPFMLLLDPASVCQLQCPMCPTGLDNAGRGPAPGERWRPHALMQRELFDALIDELGPYLFFVLLYNWGEPLLNRELVGFVRRLSALGIATEVHSNLSLPLSDAEIDRLVDSGLDRLEASIDGFSQASYGRYRVKGRFELARDNLVRIARARDRRGSPMTVVWNFLVFRFNEHEVAAAQRFCEAHGIVFVRREAAVSAELRAEFLPSYRQDEPPSGFFEARRAPFEARQFAARAPTTCAWHYFYSVINADGSVSPCCAPWEARWDMGRVIPGRRGFLDVWRGRRYRRARGDVAGTRLLRWLRLNGQIKALRRVEDFARIGTLCEGCVMPSAMLDLYSSLADRVVEHYERELAARYPDLAGLFSWVRRDADAFVQAYERWLSGQAAGRSSVERQA